MSRTDEKYIQQLKTCCREASKTERGIMLEEFAETTVNHRKHAIAVLNGRRERVPGPIRRPRHRVYGAEEVDAILILGELFDTICSELVRAAMGVEMPPGNIHS